MLFRTETICTGCSATAHGTLADCPATVVQVVQHLFYVGPWPTTPKPLHTSYSVHHVAHSGAVDPCQLGPVMQTVKYLDKMYYVVEAMDILYQLAGAVNTFGMIPYSYVMCGKQEAWVSHIGMKSSSNQPI